MMNLIKHIPGLKNLPALEDRFCAEVQKLQDNTKMNGHVLRAVKPGKK